jgi:hypothetical protein
VVEQVLLEQVVVLVLPLALHRPSLLRKVKFLASVGRMV